METIKIGDHELKTQEVAKALQDAGHIVRTKEEDSKAMQTFLEGLSHEDERVNHLIGPVTRKERESFEEAVKDLTGMDKISVDGKIETALDYAKRAFGETKKNLELKAQEGVKDDELKNKLAQIEKDFADAEKNWKKKEQEREKELKQIGFKSRVESYISGKQMKDDLDTDLLNSHINLVKQEALNSQFETRKLGEEDLEVLISSNGSVDYDNSGNPMTISRFIDSKLSKYYHEDRRMNGNGTKNPEGGSKRGEFSMNPDIKTRSQLITSLEESGLKNGSEEFMTLYKEHSKDLPVVSKVGQE